MANPKKENFKVKKMKIGNSGGAQIDFELSEVIGGESYVNNESVNSSKEPHPDLADKLHAMAPMVAQVLGFTGARTVVFTNEFKADALQKEFITKYVDEMTGKIRVTGISLSGQDDNEAVIITASLACDNNQRTAVNTPRILFSGSSRGFEEKLKELVEGLKDEAFEFVYKSKVANPELFPYEQESEAV